MISREKHTEWLADLTIDYSNKNDLDIMILGKSFKKETNLINGSPSYLLNSLLEEKNYEAKMFDPFIDEDEFLPEGPMVCFIGTNHDLCKTYEFPKGSVVIDPWRIITFDNDIELVSIGVS